jgi:hypothetical protein
MAALQARWPVVWAKAQLLLNSSGIEDYSSTPRAWGDPRGQSQGICIASLASQEEERVKVKVLKKSSRKGNDLSRGQGDDRTLEKRVLLIYNHTDT